MLKFLLPLALALAWMPAATAQDDPVVGRVGDVEVRASQITGDADEQGHLLRVLVIEPAMQDYFKQYADDIQLTKAEQNEAVLGMRRAVACIEPAHRPQARNAEEVLFIATLLTTNVKLQRFIYQRFGGGRLLFQQSGIEAFDATRRLVEHLEAQGKFEFTSSDWRALAMHYWQREDMPLIPASEADQSLRLDRPFISCDQPAAD